MYKFEICANSVASCIAAQEGGADRVELCAGIPEGGTTPSYGMIRSARENITIALIPVAVMSWVMQAVIKRVTTGVWDIVIGIDLTVVMVVVVMLMMSKIFRYGAMLQTESDETL